MKRETLVRTLTAAALGALLPLLLALSFVVGVPAHGDAPRRLLWTPPHAGPGDELHYLVVVNSLVWDHDLELQDDYARVRRGGSEAGRHYRGWFIDHHSIVVDRETGDRALWSNAFDASRMDPKCLTASCYAFPRLDPRFPDPTRIVERSSHPIGYPAVLAAGLALTRTPDLDAVETRVTLFSAVFAWLAAIVTYRLARRVGLGRGASLLAVLLLTFASTWLPYARSYYPETLLGLLLVASLWAVDAERPILTALLLGLGVWIRPAIALVGFAWIVEGFWRGSRRAALTLAGGLALAVLAFGAFNYAQAGTPNISGNGDWHRFTYPHPLAPLFDSTYGLLGFVPWALVGLAAIAASFRATPAEASPRLRRRMAIPLALHYALLTLTVSLGGTCYGPRYWVSFLPWLAVAAVSFAAQSGRAVRALLVVLALTSTAIAVPAALLYPVAFYTPPLGALRVLTIGGP